MEVGAGAGAGRGARVARARVCLCMRVASVVVGVVQRPELTEAQKAEINEAWSLFDSDKEGTMDFHELKVRRRGLAPSPTPVRPQS